MTATAILHNAWNCRWSRPAQRMTGLSAAVQPENLWVCVHEGTRRPVSDDECAHCSQWDTFATTADPVAVFPLSHRVLAEAPRIDVRVAFNRDAVARGALRAVLVLIAIVFAAIGFTVLTSALAIPFTVALWLCAATSLGFAAFGRFAPAP